MIPRTNNYDWGSHEVYSRDLTVFTNVDTSTGEISINGNFRTIKRLFDTQGSVIATEQGPNISFDNPDFTETITLSNGTELTIGQVIEAITEFYKKTYDEQKLAEKELI